MIRINEEVPDFEAEAYHEGETKTVKLSDYKGKWVAVVFYPADFTFVCPTELTELADLGQDFRDEGVQILSVSTDTVFAHKAWHDTSDAIGKVDYPMLADPTGKISKLFGTYISEGPDAGLALRGSFLIDPQGLLKTIEIHNNDVGRSGHELLRKVRAAKFVEEHGGEVCPASWTPGADTLKPGMDLVGKI